MKLAELCTAYPENCDAPAIRHPGDALSLSVRLKIRSQRGRLQSALDEHPQKSANRSGLGLRPYLPGDSPRALSLRHLLLQGDLQTRIDSSPGRFCISIFVHCYDNMEFRSSSQLPNKLQTAWAVAGVLEHLHTQQAQKVGVHILRSADLSQALLEHRALIKRSHFCYIITDLLHNPSNKSAAVDSFADTLKFINATRGMTLVVRDPMESTDWPATNEASQLAFEPRGAQTPIAGNGSTPEYQAGPAYLRNVKEQLDQLREVLQRRGWDSMWCTPEHPFEQVLQQLTLRLSGLRISQ